MHQILPLADTVQYKGFHLLTHSLIYLLTYTAVITSDK